MEGVHQDVIDGKKRNLFTIILPGVPLEIKDAKECPKEIPLPALWVIEASDVQADADTQKTGGVFVEHCAERKCAQSPFALGFWTLMDVCNVKVTDEVGFLSSSVFQSTAHLHEGANLDHSCNQRVCVSPCHPDTSAPWHEERVIPVREVSHLHVEFYQRDVTGGMRSPWTLPVFVV